VLAVVTARGLPLAAWTSVDGGCRRGRSCVFVGGGGSVVVVDDIVSGVVGCGGWQLDLALNDLNMCLEMDPRRLDALVVRSSVFIHTKNYGCGCHCPATLSQPLVLRRSCACMPLLIDSRGLEDAVHATALNPSMRDAWVIRGEAEVSLGLIDASIETLNKALSLATSKAVRCQPKSSILSASCHDLLCVLSPTLSTRVLLSFILVRSPSASSSFSIFPTRLFQPYLPWFAVE
jgi:hypothetical protein